MAEPEMDKTPDPATVVKHPKWEMYILLTAVGILKPDQLDHLCKTMAYHVDKRPGLVGLDYYAWLAITELEACYGEDYFVAGDGSRMAKLAVLIQLCKNFILSRESHALFHIFSPPKHCLSYIPAILDALATHAGLVAADGVCRDRVFQRLLIRLLTRDDSSLTAQILSLLPRDAGFLTEVFTTIISHGGDVLPDVLILIAKAGGDPATTIGGKTLPQVARDTWSGRTNWDGTAVAEDGIIFRPDLLKDAFHEAMGTDKMTKGRRAVAGSTAGDVHARALAARGGGGRVKGGRYPRRHPVLPTIPALLNNSHADSEDADF